MIRPPAALRNPHIINVAHTIHPRVMAAEHCCHFAYLGMVTAGATTYWMAAGAMLATSLLSVLIHWIVNSAAAS